MDRMTDAAETIYVAVGKAVEESKHTLLWALQNLCPTKVCILHVHQPASLFNSSRMNFTASRLHQQEIGKKILDRIMNDYLLICGQKSVEAAKLNIEMDDAGKGIVELIRDQGIKKLVMGAAANKHFSEGMTDLKSEKAQYVELHALPSCKIWSLVENGQSNLSSSASSSSYWTVSNKVASSSDSSVSETLGESPDWLEFNEGSGDDKVFENLEQALFIAEKSNQEAFDELDRRLKAEKDALNAVVRQTTLMFVGNNGNNEANEMKSSYIGELRRRKEIEGTLRKQNEELEQVKQQRDEARKIARTHKLLLESRGAKSDHVKVLEAKVSSAMEQLQIYQRELSTRSNLSKF
ncbi:hypothetical protein GOBAR_DD12772 [Gossypium barbadense]|nr:hypothetical protein GOBAR_DD12772 [Gossypium barbadense]